MKQPRHGYHRLFQDAISVTIPLEVTADMGVAISRTRTKRIQKLRESFPFLVKKEKDALEEKDSDHDKDDDDAPKKSNNNNNKTNMPQRHEYGSVLDYLEAKYVKGVMIHDDDDDDASSNNDASSDDDKRSVYSEGESSFLDDSELKRDVAGQVMSQSIQTKLQEEGEDDFFVNVGNLEVQDADNLMDYDPLADDVVSKKKKVKKRKRASSVDSKKSTPKQKKKATSTATTSPTKKSIKSPPKPKLDAKQEEKLKQQKEMAEEYKQVMMLLHQQVVDAIREMTDEELPRKKKNTKLSIVVPPGKKAGDSILFSNPHVPGQRLKAKVGAKLQPGDKFIVSVPAPPQPESDNKFSREFQDLLDEYSQAHDEWCQAKSLVEKDFSQHSQRMKKFDDLIKEFPNNLVTPIDAVYMRKVVRRARQNRHKRKKNQGKDAAGSKKEEDSNKMQMTVPGKGTVFEPVEYEINDFSA